MLFYRTGDRRKFEEPYFKRRNSLSAAALLLLVTEEEAYLDYVQRMLWAICDEYSWAVPAHTKGDPETDPFEIDLFNAETAFAPAEILFVLEDRLDVCVRVRVRAEIKRRIFDPFLARVQWYEHLNSNWAAVCAGNVGGAMLYLDPALFERSLPRLLHSMKLFLGGFSEEGICMEGTAYWTYGFSNFVWFADLLSAHTNGRIDLLDDPRAALIATYMQKSFLKAYITGGRTDVASLMTRPSFVRLDAVIDELLEEMSENKCYLSVVLDREGKPLGVVTIEDFLEELVGEIFDEDEVVNPDFLKLG
jgi:hypothetical protein